MFGFFKDMKSYFSVHVKLNRILYQLDRMENKMDEATQKLLDEVAALETVTDGVVAIIENAVQEMRDNAGDEAAINAAADRLDAVKTKLANAAIEGTPATDETTSEEPIPVTDEPATTTEPAPVAGDEIDANA